MSWFHQIPIENIKVYSAIKWLDVGQHARVFPLSGSTQCIALLDRNMPGSWLDAAKGATKADQKTVRHCIKGIDNVSDVLRQAFIGKYGVFFFSQDVDILRDSSLNLELASLLSPLKAQNWRFIFLSNSPYLSDLANLLTENFFRAIQNKIDIIFCGFGQPLPQLLSKIFMHRRQGENFSFTKPSNPENGMIEIEVGPYNQALCQSPQADQGIFNIQLWQTIHLLASYTSVRIHILIDAPNNDIEGSKIASSRLDLVNCIKHSVRRVDLTQRVGILFWNKSEAYKLRTLADFFSNRGHSLSILADSF